MSKQCQHSKLRNGSKTTIRCVSEATLIDKLGRHYCANHYSSGAKPLQLIVEAEYCSIIEQDFPAEIESIADVVNIVNIVKRPCSFVDLTESERIVSKFNFPYQSLGELVEHHSVYLPKAKIVGCEWRMLSCAVQGEVNGLPMMRGFALATNGIHVAIETSSGALIFGHREWFVVDAKERESSGAKELLNEPPALAAQARTYIQLHRQLSKLEKELE